MKMKAFSLMLRREQIKELKRISAKTGMMMAEAIRRGIDMFIEKHKKG